MSAAMRTGAGAGAGISTGPRPLWKSSPYVPVDDDEPDPPPNANVRVPGAVGARKKGAALGVRTWLAVEATGEARVVEAGKQAIMRRTGLPARDLRILDPQLSYPSTVLGRERAIVVNLEHIKAIVTAHEVLLLNFRDAAVAPFVHELQRRLLHRHSAQEDVVGSSTEWTNADGVEDPKWSAGRPLQVVEDNDTGNSRSCAKAFPSCSGEDDKEKEQMTGHEPRVLPFEFIALEACLESACSCLENEATMLEKEAHPALDKLTSKISTLNLERVRQIKSRLVAINGRVQKVRDELEHLLDDDDDMAEMYLTDKLMQQDLSDGSSDSALYFQGTAMDDERKGADISSEENDIVHNAETDPHNDKNLHGLSEIDIVNADSHGTRSFSTRSSSKHLEVQELEMLLEAYFVQIDSTLNKLSTLREYVDDTEDYINIMLDDKQNHLLQMGVVLTTATLIVSAFVVLVGIFGMNIQVDLFDKTKSGTREFLWTVGSGAMGSVVLYVIAIAWCKQRRLLE